MTETVTAAGTFWCEFELTRMPKWADNTWYAPSIPDDPMELFTAYTWRKVWANDRGDDGWIATDITRRQIRGEVEVHNIADIEHFEELQQMRKTISGQQVDLDANEYSMPWEHVEALVQYFAQETRPITEYVRPAVKALREYFHQAIAEEPTRPYAEVMDAEQIIWFRDRHGAWRNATSPADDISWADLVRRGTLVEIDSETAETQIERNAESQRRFEEQAPEL